MRTLYGKIQIRNKENEGIRKIIKLALEKGWNYCYNQLNLHLFRDYCSNCQKPNRPSEQQSQAYVKSITNWRVI